MLGRRGAVVVVSCFAWRGALACLLASALLGCGTRQSAPPSPRDAAPELEALSQPSFREPGFSSPVPIERGSPAVLAVSYFMGEGATPSSILFSLDLETGRELARSEDGGGPIGAAGSRVWVKQARGGLALRDALSLRIVGDKAEIIRRNPGLRDMLPYPCKHCDPIHFSPATGAVCVPAGPHGSYWHLIAPDSLAARRVDGAEMKRTCMRRPGVLEHGGFTASLPARTIEFVHDRLTGDERRRRLAVGRLDKETWFTDPAFLMAGSNAATLEKPDSVLVSHSDGGRSSSRRSFLSRIAVDDGRVIWSFDNTDEILSARMVGQRLILASRKRLTALDMRNGRAAWTFLP
jgi:hypothetical protein